VAVLVMALVAGPAFGQAQGQGSNSGIPPSGTGSGSAPKKTKSQLEELLDRASSNHPDIKVAEAKLRTAAAELERARSLVLQQILSLHYAIQAQKIAVDRAQENATHLEKLSAKGGGFVTKGEVEKGRTDLIAAKAKLSELQAQMDHLTGKAAEDQRKAAARALSWLALQQAGGRSADGATLLGGLKVERTVPQGAMAERIRKALDKPTSMAARNVPLGEVIERLQNQRPSLTIQVKGSQGLATKVSISVDDMPLGAVLQSLEDSLTGYHLVVREYGVLFAPEGDVPPGAVPLVEFWKGSKAKATEKKPR
jgi:hypothetical protein